MSHSQGQAGEVVGNRFVLERQLGLGGFGAVWLASDGATPGGSAALKILHPRHRSDTRVLDRFVREARVLGQLEHPNIARPIAWSVDGAYAYIAMEYVPGTPLNQEIVLRARMNSRFSDDELLEISDQIVSAVAHAHSKEIVHRDLKPSNVVLIQHVDRLEVKVLDFGLAKILDGEAHDATTVGRVFGSHLYCSPEQARGMSVDHRTDIFGLGTMLFELLTLSRAWAVDERGRPLKMLNLGVVREPPNDNVSIGMRIASGQRPRPSVVSPELGTAVDQVLARAMAIDPEQRYPTASELGHAFEEALRSTRRIDGEAVAPVEPLEPAGMPDTMVAPRELVAGEGREATRAERPRSIGSSASGAAATKIARPIESVKRLAEPPPPDLATVAQASEAATTLRADRDAALREAAHEAAREAAREGTHEVSRDGALDGSRDSARDGSRDSARDGSRDSARAARDRRPSSAPGRARRSSAPPQDAGPGPGEERRLSNPSPGRAPSQPGPARRSSAPPAEGRRSSAPPVEGRRSSAPPAGARPPTAVHDRGVSVSVRRSPPWFPLSLLAIVLAGSALGLRAGWLGGGSNGAIDPIPPLAGDPTDPADSARSPRGDPTAPAARGLADTTGREPGAQGGDPRDPAAHEGGDPAAGDPSDANSTDPSHARAGASQLSKPGDPLDPGASAVLDAPSGEGSAEPTRAGDARRAARGGEGAAPSESARTSKRTAPSKPSPAAGTTGAPAAPATAASRARRTNPVLDAIAKKLARARQTPDDYPQMRALGQQMLEAKDRIADPEVRVSVERCVTNAAFLGGDVDLDALERCYKKLEQAMPADR